MCAVFAVFVVFSCLQFIIPGTICEKNFPSRIEAIRMHESDG